MTPANGIVGFLFVAVLTFSGLNVTYGQLNVEKVITDNQLYKFSIKEVPGAMTATLTAKPGYVVQSPVLGPSPVSAIANVMELGYRFNYLQFVVITGEYYPDLPRAGFDPFPVGSPQFSQFVDVYRQRFGITAQEATADIIRRKGFTDDSPFYWNQSGPSTKETDKFRWENWTVEPNFYFLDATRPPARTTYHFLTMLVVSERYFPGESWYPLHWWMWQAENPTGNHSAIPNLSSIAPLNVDQFVPVFMGQRTIVDPNDPIPANVTISTLGHSMNLMEIPQWIRQELINAGGAIPNGPTQKGSVDYEAILGATAPPPTSPADVRYNLNVTKIQLTSPYTVSSAPAAMSLSPVAKRFNLQGHLTGTYAMTEIGLLKLYNLVPQPVVQGTVSTCYDILNTMFLVTVVPGRAVYIGSGMKAP